MLLMDLQSLNEKYSFLLDQYSELEKEMLFWAVYSEELAKESLFYFPTYVLLIK